MARRREAHDEELPFVALMDTMTNVVGVLIIVLVMIGISLASSVKKVLSELPDVTVEQLEEVKKQLADVTPKEDPKKVEDETKKLEEQIKKNNEDLKTFDVADGPQKAKMIDLDDLNKQIEQRKKDRDLKKTDVEKQLAEVDRLKALLSTTPEYVPPPSTVVKLPNPRPMPANAVMQRFLVVGDKIVYLNEAEFMRVVEEAFEKQHKSLILPNPIKDAFGQLIMAGDKPKVFLDRKKVEAFFADRLRISTRDLKVELAGTPNSSRMNLKMSIQPTGGENLAAISQPNSVFQRAMRKFGSEPNTVVWFLVSKNAIPTYLAAREIADRSNVAAGWELTNNDFFQRQIASFEVDFIPAKPQPPPPQGTIRIAPPKATLD